METKKEFEDSLKKYEVKSDGTIEQKEEHLWWFFFLNPSRWMLGSVVLAAIGLLIQGYNPAVFGQAAVTLSIMQTLFVGMAALTLVWGIGYSIFVYLRAGPCRPYKLVWSPDEFFERNKPISEINPYIKYLVERWNAISRNPRASCAIWIPGGIMFLLCTVLVIEHFSGVTLSDGWVHLFSLMSQVFLLSVHAMAALPGLGFLGHISDATLLSVGDILSSIMLCLAILVVTDNVSHIVERIATPSENDTTPKAKPRMTSDQIAAQKKAALAAVEKRQQEADMKLKQEAEEKEKEKEKEKAELIARQEAEAKSKQTAKAIAKKETVLNVNNTTPKTTENKNNPALKAIDSSSSQAVSKQNSEIPPNPFKKDKHYLVQVTKAWKRNEIQEKNTFFDYAPGDYIWIPERNKFGDAKGPVFGINIKNKKDVQISFSHVKKVDENALKNSEFPSDQPNQPKVAPKQNDNKAIHSNVPPRMAGYYLVQVKKSFQKSPHQRSNDVFDYGPGSFIYIPESTPFKNNQSTYGKKPGDEHQVYVKLSDTELVDSPSISVPSSNNKTPYASPLSQPIAKPIELKVKQKAPYTTEEDTECFNRGAHIYLVKQDCVVERAFSKERIKLKANTFLFVVPRLLNETPDPNLSVQARIRGTDEGGKLISVMIPETNLQKVSKPEPFNVNDYNFDDADTGIGTEYNENDDSGSDDSKYTTFDDYAQPKY
jgi:hypothetical protein